MNDTRKLHLRQRGAASLEAIALLLTLSSLWVAIGYVGRLGVDQIETRASARECAWTITMSGCRTVPDHCSSRYGYGKSSDKADALEEAGEDASSGSNVADALRDLLLARIRGVFGGRVTASAGRDRKQPESLGGRTARVGASYSLPCNTRPVELESLADELFDLVRGE